MYKCAQIITILIPNASINREVILAIGQIGFQLLFLMLKTDKKTNLNYVGNLITISLLGALILVPIILLSSIFVLPGVFDLNLVWNDRLHYDCQNITEELIFLNYQNT